MSVLMSVISAQVLGSFKAEAVEDTAAYNQDVAQYVEQLVDFQLTAKSVYAGEHARITEKIDKREKLVPLVETKLRNMTPRW